MKTQPLTRTEQLLVTEARERGLQVARRILRSWQIRLPEDEVQSAVDLALCDAVRHFDPTREVQFVTYARLYIRGALWETVAFQNGLGHGTPPPLHEGDEERSFEPADQRPLPDQQYGYQQIRTVVAKAMANVSPTGRDVVVEVDLLGHKLNATAQRLGYSRGHLHEIRRKALEYLRAELMDYAEAA